MLIWFLIFAFVLGYVIVSKVQTQKKQKQEIESLKNEFKDIIEKNPNETIDYACEFLRIYGEESNKHLDKFKRFIQLQFNKNENENEITFELRNAHKRVKKEKELPLLNHEFKTMLNKNPKDIDDHINVFFETYGNDSKHKVNRFKQLISLKFNLNENEFESKINERVVQNSNEYEFIHSFVKKYESDYTNNDLDNLHSLLKQKGVKLDKFLLRKLVKSEYLKQEYDRFKERILMLEPSTREDFIKVFLEMYPNNNSEYLDYFNELMLKLGFEELYPFHIPRYNKEMELENFEKQLKNDCMRKYSIWQIDTMNGFEFENFLAELYQNMGYSIKRTPYSRDQGADLIVSKYGEKSVIQAKNYIDKVSNKAVQEVVAAKGYYKCKWSIVVTNNYFTNSAKDLANANDVELIDRDKLEILINKYL